MATGFARIDGFPRSATAAAVNGPPVRLDGVIAVVGCDGTGKTTLVADLVRTLGRQRPVERRYMGLVSGEAGDRIRRLPVIGVALERHLARKVRRAQDMEKPVPGVAAAAIMYLFSVYRVGQLKRLMRLAGGETLVIADRYPQAEVAGFHYDGPGISAERSGNWLVRRLAAREQRLYDWMSRHRPALIIRLGIDPETAFARKADHPLAELTEKIRIMPGLHYNGARVSEIDARMPYPQVLEAALSAIRTATAA